MRPVAFSAAAAAAAFLLPSCAENAPEAVPVSHERMIAELAEVASRTDAENWFLGDSIAIERRKIVASFDTDTPPSERFDGLMYLGLAELNLGNERAAIELFTRADQVPRSPDIPANEVDQCHRLLGIAWLRLGETANCCRLPNADSCIFPLKAGGLHSDPEGSRNAIRWFESVIASPTADPYDKLESVWLANLAYMTLGEAPMGLPEKYRLKDFRPNPSAEFPRFPNVAASFGINTYSLAGGAVFDDFDGDGWPDLVLTSWDPAEDMRFFRNEAGRQFSDHSKAANFSGITGGLNLRHADYDNDGDLDLLVLRGAWLGEVGRHPNSLLRNDGLNREGVPRFVDVTFEAGLGDVHHPTQTAEWADYDLDGDLDLFVGNEAGESMEAPSQLFRNEGPDAEGRVTFVDVAVEAGVTNDRYSKGVSWGDVNGDRYPDLFVSNLEGDNRLYLNQGDGRFIDRAPECGLEGPHRSFPAWFWDFDNDGNLDIFVSYYRESGPAYLKYYLDQWLHDSLIASLYAGDGRGNFRNVVRETGLDVPMVPMGSNFGDLDNDGFPDIYLGTGTPEYSSVVPNLLLINRRGERFEDLTIPAGMGHLQKGHAISFVDFDRDGDVDVFEQMGGALKGDPYYDALFENPGSPENHWLGVRLKGVQSNSYGIGCRIRAVIDEDGKERSVYVHLNSGGSFGANPLIAHLGLGKAKSVKRLEVFWPVTGETQAFENVPADQRIVVTEGQPAWKKS